MAKMIPNNIDYNPKIKGEIEIFNLLKNSKKTEDWIVLHSLELSQHISQVTGEIDFVIIVPHSGILCVEVKGVNKVSRDGQGNWHCGSSNKIDRRGPFKQANDAMHSLKNYIKDINPDIKNVLFWYAVIFPFCPFNIDSPEWESWQVVDQKKLKARDIGEIIYEILSYAKMYAKSKNVIRLLSENAEPSLDQCDIICNILRPEFDFSGSQKSNYVSDRYIDKKIHDQEVNKSIPLNNENDTSDFRRLSKFDNNYAKNENEVNKIIFNFSKTSATLFENTLGKCTGIKYYTPIYDLCNKIAYAYEIELLINNHEIISQKIINLLNPIIINDNNSDLWKCRWILCYNIYSISKTYERLFSMRYGIGKAINYYIKQLYTKEPIVDDDIIVAYEIGKLLGVKKYKS